MLRRLYELAKTSVFATSDATYLSVWKSPFGEKLLEAHENGQASVTRVFVFNDGNELSKETMAIMEKHNNTDHVHVRAYFDSEYPSFEFTADLARDFTVIDDGEVIGITEGIVSGIGQARWYFKDENKIGSILMTKAALEDGSVPFPEVKKWWDDETAAKP